MSTETEQDVDLEKLMGEEPPRCQEFEATVTDEYAETVNCERPAVIVAHKDVCGHESYYCKQHAGGMWYVLSMIKYGQASCICYICGVDTTVTLRPM